jgi:hypothetical protein
MQTFAAIVIDVLVIEHGPTDERIFRIAEIAIEIASTSLFADVM